PLSGDLIRAGRRMAAGLRAPWIALTVEDPQFEALPEAQRERLSENIVLAQRLGAEALIVRGDDVAAQVLSVARERGITRILVGRPRRSRWRAWLRPSWSERIVREAGTIDVLVTSGEPDARSAPRAHVASAFAPPREYVWALLAVLLPTAICTLTRD